MSDEDKSMDLANRANEVQQALRKYEEAWEDYDSTVMAVMRGGYWDKAKSDEIERLRSRERAAWQRFRQVLAGD